MSSLPPPEPHRSREEQPVSEFDLEQDKRYLRKIAIEKIGNSHEPLIEASDLVQETLFEAVRHRELLRNMPRRTRLRWMRKVLIHRLTDLIRRMNTAKRGSGQVASMDISSPAVSSADGLLDPAESPSKIVSKWEEEDRVKAAIDQLPDTDRGIILARDFDGLDFTTISARLNLTPEAARKRYERAIARLATLLSSSDEGGSAPHHRTR